MDLAAALLAINGSPKIDRLRKSFFDIPQHVRSQIYRYAGLVHDWAIDLNHIAWREDRRHEDLIDPSLYLENDGNYDIRQTFCELQGCYFQRRRFPYRFGIPRREYRFDVCQPLPYSLLYISQTIHNEVSALLYGENKFIICQRYPGALCRLQSLGRNTLAAMTSLSIILNYCPYKNESYEGVGPHQPAENMRLCKCDQKSVNVTGPLSNISRHDKNVLAEWTQVCHHIGDHICQRSMSLSLICDSANYDIALAVVRPMFRLTMLAECTIRLGENTHDQKLHSLAEETVLRVTGSR